MTVCLNTLKTGGILTLGKKNKEIKVKIENYISYFLNESMSLDLCRVFSK